jgi:lysophospholipase
LNVTLSSIVNESNFVNHQMPLPILQTIELTDADVKLFGLEVPFANDTTVDLPVTE